MHFLRVGMVVVVEQQFPRGAPREYSRAEPKVVFCLYDGRRGTALVTESQKARSFFTRPPTRTRTHPQDGQGGEHGGCEGVATHVPPAGHGRIAMRRRQGSPPHSMHATELWPQSSGRTCMQACW